MVWLFGVVVWTKQLSILLLWQETCSVGAQRHQTPQLYILASQSLMHGALLVPNQGAKMCALFLVVHMLSQLLLGILP